MAGKLTRNVFVIMPFVRVEGGARDEQRLTAFFRNHIKRPIEAAQHLQHRYVVNRSGEAFNITRGIIKAMCNADIVIADLSGTTPNANVMYELGVRLAVSEGPVILVKEDIPGADNPFDVFNYFTKPYDPLDYGPLEEHLIAKIARLESGEEVFDNEVLRLVREELAILTPDLSQVSPDRQRELVTKGVDAAAVVVETGYGPHGRGLQRRSGAGPTLLVTRGLALCQEIRSDNAYEDQGARFLQAAAAEVFSQLQDGSKLAAIMTRAMIREAGDGGVEGVLPSQLADELQTIARKAAALMSREKVSDVSPRLAAVAATAAKVRDFPVDVEAVFAEAGADGIVTVEDWEGSAIRVDVDRGYRIDRGVLHEDFLTEADGTRASLKDAAVLLCIEPISSMLEFLPILEKVAAAKRPLLLVVPRIEGEALATLRVNVERGSVRCVPVGAPGFGDRRTDMLNDIATLTGGVVMTEGRGLRLQSAVLSDLGSADVVTVTKSWTRIDGGHGDAAAVQSQIGRLRAMISQQESDYEREKLWERIALLSGRYVTIKVGAESVDARRIARQVVDEGLAACRNARSNGVIPGAPSVFERVAALVRGGGQGLSESEQARRVVAAGLEAPLRALARNAGLDSEAASRWAADGHALDVRRPMIAAEDGCSVWDAAWTAEQALRIAADRTSEFLRTGTWIPSRPASQQES